ncbi:MAG: RluA family pseudouridine synthase [Clostridia bacterium]|nr:RluA family pseudouridine synthase [Clostridia bacterium]
MLELICDKTQSLKEFTENHYAQASFFWTALLKSREIKVNGKRVGADTHLFAGDVVTYYLTPKQASKAAFYLVYEDENVLVVDKESGVNSEAVFAELARKGEYYFLHRLDRNTTGLMLFARNPKAEKEILNAFKEKRIEKKYLALCFGAFPKEQDVLVAYLKKNADNALARIYDTPVNGAEKIVTEYKVLEKRGETTLVEITLHTGKTHQIRAHLAHICCPIVGDMKYGITAQNKALKRARQCLTAKSLQVELSGEFAYLNRLVWTSRFDAEIVDKE